MSEAPPSSRAEEIAARVCRDMVTAGLSPEIGTRAFIAKALEEFKGECDHSPCDDCIDKFQGQGAASMRKRAAGTVECAKIDRNTLTTGAIVKVISQAIRALPLVEGEKENTPEVRILKKRDDPICTRLSLGGTADVGWYCVYRGSIDDAIYCAEEVLTALRQLSEEPPISPDDGKEFA